MLLLLVVAVALAFAFPQRAEGVAIVAVIAVNSDIGFVSERRAIRSMEALRKMGKRETRVRRDGRELSVAVSTLVPGDIVILEGGDLVPPDIRLYDANALRVDESALTGESVVVVKRIEPVDEEAPLVERRAMLCKGTPVLEGSGQGIVVATGLRTELGKIAEMVGEAEKEVSPLQRRLDRLENRLAWVTIGLAVIVAVLGLLSRQPNLPDDRDRDRPWGSPRSPKGLPIVGDRGSPDSRTGLSLLGRSLAFRLLEGSPELLSSFLEPPLHRLPRALARRFQVPELPLHLLALRAQGGDSLPIT